MEKLKLKFMEFMRGRNGSDELYFAMFVVSVLLDIIDLFVDSRLLTILAAVMMVLTFFRFFSKNIYQRQKENAKFLEILGKISNKNFSRNPYEVKKDSKLKKKINAWKIRFRDRKTHVFKKCPGCQAVIRLPKRKGKHTVCCPRCSQNFNVKIR